MTRTKKPAWAIDEVRGELRRPRIAASAQRRLMLIDNLRGYECSVCECRVRLPANLDSQGLFF
jgi:hypothetical protein